MSSLPFVFHVSCVWLLKFVFSNFEVQKSMDFFQRAESLLLQDPTDWRISLFCFVCFSPFSTYPDLLPFKFFWTDLCSLIDL